jgi:hypothetical protein
VFVWGCPQLSVAKNIFQNSKLIQKDIKNNRGEREDWRMTRKKTSWVAGVMGALILLWVPGAMADVPELLNQFHPYIDVQGTWDDNINLTQDGKVSDFITKIAPGLRYKAKGSGYGLTLDYQLGFNFYATNTQNNYVSQDGRLNGFYDIDRHWTVRLNETLTRSRDGIQTYFTTGSGGGQQINPASGVNQGLYLRNIVEPSVEYKFGRENVASFLYRNMIYQTDNNSSSGNSTENAVTPRLAYWFNIHNGITLDYTYDKATYEKEQNWISNIIAGRYIYRFNPRSRVYGNYVYMLKDFDGNYHDGPTTPDYSTHSPTVGVEHAFSATLSGKAEFGWFWQVVDAGPSMSGPVYNFSITQLSQKTTYTLALQGGYREQYFTSDNLGFSKYNQIMANITHKLQERLTLGLTGTLGRDEYENPSRTDNNWGLIGTLSYQPLKWLTVSLEGSSQARESDLNGNSYRDNRGILRLTAEY